MDLEHLTENAKIKGLNLLGTGDFTHPLWLKELKAKLKPNGLGLYTFNGVYFMLTCEVSTIYEQGDKVRKVHHVLHAPDFETVDQIVEIFSKHARLEVDGRPILPITSPELVELVGEISKEIFVVPAHAWTPWFGIFGSKSGFDSMEECYQDMTGRIFALETGLSSDPAMNWRLSALDRYTLMSNSDSHSPWPLRIGRELNVFDLEKSSYRELWDAVKRADKEKFLFTVEVDPAYGKYHYDGHRQCNVSMHPREAIKRGNICPVCRKPLTIGVLHRVEELADREEGYVRSDAIPFKSLLPLEEVIDHVFSSLKRKNKQFIYNRLIEKFGSELRILIDADIKEIEHISGLRIAKAIEMLRSGAVEIKPGYDGVYGVPIFDIDDAAPDVPEAQLHVQREFQSKITDF